MRSIAARCSLLSSTIPTVSMHTPTRQKSDSSIVPVAVPILIVIPRWQLIAAYDESSNLYVLDAAVNYLDTWLRKGESMESLPVVCFYYTMISYQSKQPVLRDLAEFCGLDPAVLSARCNDFLVRMEGKLWVDKGHLSMLQGVGHTTEQLYASCLASVFYFETGTFSPAVFYAAITGADSDAADLELCKGELASALEQFRALYGVR